MPVTCPGTWDLEPLRRKAIQLGTGLNGASAAIQIDHLWGFLNGPLESVIDLVGGADAAPDVLLQQLSVDPAGVYVSPSPVDTVFFKRTTCCSSSRSPAAESTSPASRPTPTARG
jgi:hypothetical protein